MTKSKLKRELIKQRAEAVIGGDRKDLSRLGMFKDYIDIIRKRIREGLYANISNEEIFTTELLKQDDVKLH